MEAGRFGDEYLDSRKAREHLRASRWSAISISAGATKKRNQVDKRGLLMEVPDLPSPLSPSLSRRLAGKRCPGGHAFRPLLRTGGGGFVSSRRSSGSSVRAVGAV